MLEGFGFWAGWSFLVSGLVWGPWRFYGFKRPEDSGGGLGECGNWLEKWKVGLPDCGGNAIMKCLHQKSFAPTTIQPETSPILPFCPPINSPTFILLFIFFPNHITIDPGHCYLTSLNLNTPPILPQNPPFLDCIISSAPCSPCLRQCYTLYPTARRRLHQWRLCWHGAEKSGTMSSSRRRLIRKGTSLLENEGEGRFHRTIDF